ncbi:MAG: AAA family ATPase [Bacteroidales bacterium]|jgi:exodeoxyribonuclease-5|nr:AAA family ATPase [Bacteroidales bacterium]MBO7284282.1 AAA family ATPase [Bacteroidales bacterium]MBO7323336.1 AAA family ATPase [Bacteroidales bacterium]MBQ5748333.1 AAA family ATPase [Bacteroidales bacterium]
MGLADFLGEKILQNFKYEPTECQKIFFDKISRFLSGYGDGDIFILNGYAGTGKTEAIGAVVRTLKEFNMKFKLMAPTGRAAKVLSGYTSHRTSTIHKQIYRQKSMDNGVGQFSLDFNRDNDTVYIVDEASLITIDSSSSSFGSGNLLEDLISYIRNGSDNKLILIGDNAQLPPISLDRSPALDVPYMEGYGPVEWVSMKSVVRQELESGILYNATLLRKAIALEETGSFPKLQVKGYNDVESINGGELIEALEDAVSRYGLEETIVLCRSNKRANRYNEGIRAKILSREERLVRGDRLMVVKNCYQFLEDVKEIDFIANGDIAELIKIGNYEERYGLHFAQARLSFPDYDDIEISAKIILDTLDSESASLSSEQQRALYEGVYTDYEHIKTKKKRNESVREDPYYNALQIKYSSAITCHKSQGGQWKCVFIDNAFWQDEISLDELKWLYTAITRAVEKVYFVSFNKLFFE